MLLSCRQKKVFWRALQWTAFQQKVKYEWCILSSVNTPELMKRWWWQCILQANLTIQCFAQVKVVVVVWVLNAAWLSLGDVKQWLTSCRCERSLTVISHPHLPYLSHINRHSSISLSVTSGSLRCLGLRLAVVWMNKWVSGWVWCSHYTEVNLGYKCVKIGAKISYHAN